MSRQDSLRLAGDSLFFQAINEPNLGLRALRVPIFRLYYADMMGLRVITLRPNEIIVKTDTTHEFLRISSFPDTNRLNSEERLHSALHVSVLSARFLGLRKAQQNTALLRFNVIAISPSTRPAYYRLPWAEAEEMVCQSSLQPYVYTTTKIDINETEYQHLADLINASGYWTMPGDTSRMTKNLTYSMLPVTYWKPILRKI